MQPFYTILLGLAVWVVACQESSPPPQKSPQRPLSFGQGWVNNLVSNPPIDTIPMPAAPYAITRTILLDRQGKLWFATFEGLFRYDGTSFLNLTDTTIKKRFFSVLEDTKGDFWFSSVGGGLFHYDGTTFTNHAEADGLVHHRATKLLEDRAGAIWVCTEHGLSRFDGQSFQNFTTEQGLPHHGVNTIVQDSTGRYWIGTRAGACRYDPTTGDFTALVDDQGQPFKNVLHMLEDRQGNLWLGGENGLWRYSQQQFTQFSSRFVIYLYEDDQGTLWSIEETTNRAWGIYQYAHAVQHNNSTTGTLLLSHPTMLFCVAKDAQGQLWYGGLQGVYRYDGQRIRYFVPAQ